MPETSKVLQDFEKVIQVQELRLQKFLALENRSPKYAVHTTRAIALLVDLYRDRLRIRKELDLEADAAGPVFRDPDFAFLTSDEALGKRALENLIDRGELDGVEAYKIAGYLMKLNEEKAAIVAAHPNGGSTRWEAR